MSLFTLMASPDPDRWFREKSNVPHYVHYEFTKRSLIVVNENTLRTSALNDNGFLEFLEAANVVPGRTSNPDGILGVDSEGGRFFESYVERTRNSAVDRNRIVKGETNPGSFFQENLKKLVEPAISISFCDPYLIHKLAPPKGHPKVDFLKYIALANPDVQLNLVGGKPLPSQERDFNYGQAVSNLIDLLDEAGFRGKVTLKVRYWRHGRWFRVGYKQNVFVDWEPSFSVDYWNAKTFDVDHLMIFSKSDKSTNRTISDICSEDSFLDSEYPPLVHKTQRTI